MVFAGDIQGRICAGANSILLHERSPAAVPRRGKRVDYVESATPWWCKTCTCLTQCCLHACITGYHLRNDVQGTEQFLNPRSASSFRWEGENGRYTHFLPFPHPPSLPPHTPQNKSILGHGCLLVPIPATNTFQLRDSKPLLASVIFVVAIVPQLCPWPLKKISTNASYMTTRCGKPISPMTSGCCTRSSWTSWRSRLT